MCLGPTLRTLSWTRTGSRDISLTFRRTIASSISDSLQQELTARRLPLTYDYLSPQPSHLLNLSLPDVLPYSTPFASAKHETTVLPSIQSPRYMPEGHHLIYFPPQVTLSQLLPDGTDNLHYPGNPFNRRLWAGGSVTFPSTGRLLLNGQRAVCVEVIRNVNIKGREGEEKIFVTIERRFASVQEDEDEADTRSRVLDSSSSVLTEQRELVFLRDRTTQQVDSQKMPRTEQSRLVKCALERHWFIDDANTKFSLPQAPTHPEISYRITPTKALLFRFSALTFNAHLIHLDPAYTRDVEGHQDLLVHGPLTLTLMLRVLSSHLAMMGRSLRRIEYRNLAPLYVSQEMMIGAKMKEKNDPTSWEVWVKGPLGLAVRGTIWTEELHA